MTGNYPCSCGAVWTSPQELVSCRNNHSDRRADERITEWMNRHDTGDC